MKIISVVGHSDSGKTTLIEALLPELKKRELRIATVKHDVHGFQMDTPGKDTWRHAKAGADVVVISSPTKIATIQNVDAERSLNEIRTALAGQVDLIITEGYKRESMPKIETLRNNEEPKLLSDKKQLLAVVGEKPVPSFSPCFTLDQVSKLADLVLEFVKNNGLAAEKG